MNFGEMTDELAARGFDYLSDDRRGIYVNAARAELDTMHLWPYREAAATAVNGENFVVVDDLGPIRSVRDTGNNSALLEFRSRVEIEEVYEGDLTGTGTPAYYYVDTSEGVVVAHPPGGPINVQYWRRTPVLVDRGDEPLAPVDYHYVYVDLAAKRAYQDSDNFQAAQALQASIDRDVARMVADLFTAQVAGPDGHQVIHGWAADW